MFRIIRTADLATLRAEAVQRDKDASAAAAEAERLGAALARAEGELAVLRAQTHLDAEDRIVLRMLLRTVRNQTVDRRKIAVLLRRGELHSAHATPEAAEAAAVADGAPPEGWVTVAPGTPLPPAADVLWRVTVLPLQTER
ncbi:hypothetical protein [Streptomyces sp. NPDC006334]|uniref:hypothetical protein n=1 Tax=Streptomyces sp. NPDC006334 TaxID=3156754 RepID=UPI0033B3E063